MKLHRIAPAVALAAAASLALTACGDDNPTASDNNGNNAENNGNNAGDNNGDDATDDGDEATDDAGSAGGAGGYESAFEDDSLSGTLSASGASAQNAAITAWQAGFGEYQSGVTVNYNSEGSGAGRRNLIAGATQFAGSDAALDETEREEVTESCGPDGAYNLPVYISPIAIPYNLHGVDNLQLSPDTIAGIFNQEITDWNDAAIAEDNPDAELPEQPITVVNRSDESGTTDNFTEYLAAAAPDAWPHEPSDAWPVSGGEAAAQTEGVISVVSGTEGTIGYADASAVDSLTVASVGVGDDFVELSPEAAAAVVDASDFADTGVEGDLSLELARDTTEAGVYPIVLVSYHIVCSSYASQEEVDLVQGFIGYVISEEGQQLAADAAGSAPISDNIREQAQASLDSITVR